MSINGTFQARLKVSMLVFQLCCSSWQSKFLVVPGLLLNILTVVLSFEVKRLGLLSDPGIMIKHSNNLCLH